MKNLSNIAIAIAALGSVPAMAIPLDAGVLHPGRAALVKIADGFFCAAGGSGRATLEPGKCAVGG